MARYTPQNFGGDLAPLNPEFENIKQAIDDTLSRVGDTPNAVTASIDFNGNRLLNLPAPTSATEPFRKQDLPDTVAQLETVKTESIVDIEQAGTDVLNSISADTTTAVNSATLSEEWATSLTLVDGVNYGSKKYAQDASVSATSASNSASAANTSASSASTAEANAQNYAQDALGYRDTTLTYRNEAEVFRNEAQAFAEDALPIQTGNSGKYLQTNGTSSSWVDVMTTVAADSRWNATNWDTAYSWGDHSQAGYALSANLATVATSGLASDINYNATTVSAALDSKFDSTTGKATQAEAEAGTDDTQWMSSKKTHAAFQQFGLGVSGVAPIVNDADNALRSGFYSFIDASLNFPVGFGMLRVEAFDSSTGNVAQFVTGTGNAETDVWFRHFNVENSTWSQWKKTYSQSNLNVNEFGGKAGAYSVHGFGVSSNIVYFYLPINSFVLPTSITVTSTFQLIDSANSVVASGLVPTFISTRSDNRVCVISVDGLSGITTGKHYMLKTEGASSKITVNF